MNINVHQDLVLNVSSLREAIQIRKQTGKFALITERNGIYISRNLRLVTTICNNV